MHIDKVVKQIGKGLSVSQNIIGQIVNALVLSHLDYCSVVWSSTSMTQIKNLRIAQNKAARCIFRYSYKANVNTMCNCLSWLKLDGRFNISLLSFIRNILATKSPRVLYKHLCLSSDVHHTRHATQNQDSYVEERCNVQRYGYMELSA